MAEQVKWAVPVPTGVDEDIQVLEAARYVLLKVPHPARIRIMRYLREYFEANPNAGEKP